ncbi:Inositol polyphosphate kinase [Yasminevirus sp. GU-2018]|uniref:Inositol polyphosphate kinase n=1 Tax=Yasminevirus sp. GU-2018 TaxID=2420051 RepID=A0A5K0UAI4_9VIRU|nr:Inositol polyphosphate kinase [Yasminevirus sp. GU-2018]
MMTQSDDIETSATHLESVKKISSVYNTATNDTANDSSHEQIHETTYDTLHDVIQDRLLKEDTRLSESIRSHHVKSVKTAGGRSRFFVDDNISRIYKKDASGNERELCKFYSYLSDKPDLAEKFPKLFGVVRVDPTDIETLDKDTPDYVNHKSKKTSKKRSNNYFLCMENLSSYFKDQYWALDIKLASPRTTEKYHPSRSMHEFSIHGMRIPRSDGDEIVFNHKKHRDMNYDDLDSILTVLKTFFSNDNVIRSTLLELYDIKRLFGKYCFEYDCSILIMHDTQHTVVKVIDCVAENRSQKNNKDSTYTVGQLDSLPKFKGPQLKRIDYLIHLLQLLSLSSVSFSMQAHPESTPIIDLLGDNVRSVTPETTS